MSKRFRFRFQRVLGVRLIHERIAMADFARAQTRLEEEQNMLAEVLCRRKRSVHTLREALLFEIDPRSIQAHQGYLKALKDAATKQNQAVAGAQTEVDAKLKALVSARQNRKTLDRLRERELSEHTRLALLEEQKVFDDMVRERR